MKIWVYGCSIQLRRRCDGRALYWWANPVVKTGPDVGSVTFDHPEKALPALRTASGVRIHLPATITLRALQQDPTPLLLENLKVTLAAGGVEIGEARHVGDLRSPISKQQVPLMLDLTLEALAVYESIRAGGEPEFSVMLSADVRYILAGQGWKQACSIAEKHYTTTFVHQVLTRCLDKDVASIEGA